jgi:hypothetical protein
MGDVISCFMKIKLNAVKQPPTHPFFPPTHPFFPEGCFAFNSGLYSQG